MRNLLIGLGGAAIVFLLLFYFFSQNNYYKRFKVKYHPRNMFPYELNFEGRFKDNLFGNILLVASLAMFISFFIMITRLTTSGPFILLIIAGSLTAVMLGINVFLPLKFLKGHLLVAVLSFASTFALLGGIVLTYFQYYRLFNDAYGITMLIVSGVVAILYFILLVNPKISTWAKLEERKNPDGTLYYVRPKFFPLAYTEWLTFIFYMVGVALTITLFFTI